MVLPSFTNSSYVSCDASEALPDSSLSPLPAAAAQATAVSQRPISEAPLGEGAGLAVRKHVPSSFTHGSADKDTLAAAI